MLTRLLRGGFKRFKGCQRGVTTVYRGGNVLVQGVVGSYRGLSRVFQWYTESLTGVLHVCYRCVTGMVQGYCMDVTRILQGIVRGMLHGLLKGCYRGV